MTDEEWKLEPWENHAAINSRGCHDLALKSLREICIRKKQVAPRDGDVQENRWASSGPVPNDQLETVRTR